MLRETLLQGLDHACGIVHGQGGLGDESQLAGIAYDQFIDVRRGLHQIDPGLIVRAPVLAHGAFHLGVALVPDQHHLVARFAMPCDLQMHLGDQGAGGIEHGQVTLPGLLAHLLRHAVGAEDHGASIRDLGQFVDEYGAAVAQTLYHEAIVHDLVAHVDRCPEGVECAFHDLDGPVDTGTETTGVGE